MTMRKDPRLCFSMSAEKEHISMKLFRPTVNTVLFPKISRHHLPRTMYIINR